MRKLFLCFIAVCVSMTGRSDAAEPYLDFLSGLRDRGYFDSAMEYLDRIEKDARLPAEIRTVLPLERGLTLLENARTIRIPEARSTQLDQAQAQLEQFVQASPNHPRAAEANREQANIFLGRARVAVWESNSPSKASQRDELRQSARELIARARTIFQKAHDQYKAHYETFPKFIDPDDGQRLAARAEAEIDYMRAQLDLAQCTYEDGQTHEAGSDEQKQRLTKASTEFEAIHSTYRSMVGGLYARMWQGKCFEEQGDLQSALGIYNELLTHEDDSPTMRRLQDQVLQFRLICLNNESKKDYQLVVQEASDWVKNARARARTQQGLGIRWEMALAMEQLGLDAGLPDADRERMLRQSLAEAKTINRYAGQYKDVSTFLIRRLNVALGRSDADPTDFGTAFEIGRNMVKQIKPLKEKAGAAGATPEQRQDLDLHLAENARMLRLAIDLADESTVIKDLNQARYLLSYVYLLLGRNYESAILSEHVARHFKEDSPETSLDAAHLAMAAYVKAYNAVPASTDSRVELELMQKSCTYITEQWPASERANEARMTLGRVFGRQERPIDAARWYSQVPESAPQYAEAQLASGQAFWVAYLNAAVLPDGQKLPVEQLNEWRDQSRAFLERGVAKLSASLPAEAPPNEMLIAAKVSLAQIMIAQQQFSVAIESLTGGKQSVISAITVADPDQRPSEGIQSLDFARLAYQLLLRCYVGTQQIDQALEAMNGLESLGGEGNTAVYVQLGQELEKELKRLKSLNETEQLEQVRSSFESFLNELFNRQEGQSYGSLIWIAETYFGLGQGSDDNPVAATGYFGKAATTYDAILTAAGERGADFVDPSKLPAIRLRLVTCLRNKGDFPKALELVNSVLTGKPKSLDGQFEAARLLQAWGEQGGEESRERLLQAITGVGPVWGWAQLGSRLQRTLDAGIGTPEQQQKHLEARLASAECRRQYGDSEAALREIQIFATIAGADMDDAWWNRFDGLYQALQQDLGRTPEPLERPEPVASRTVNEVASVVPVSGSADTADAVSQSDATAAAVANPVTAEGAGGPSGIVIGLGLLIAVGGAGGVAFAMSRPKKRRVQISTGPPPDFSGAGSAAGKPRRSGSEQRPRKKQSGSRKTEASGERPRRSPNPADPEKRRAKPRSGADQPQRPRPKRRPDPPES